jgi:peptidoglycan/LPS O-acetylase OafA/YrhL
MGTMSGELNAGRHESGRIDRLDGIRALAIVLVFLIHVNIGRFGWQGVPLFFVLSGFLITTILRRGRTNESFWGTFYVKRATRILPPLLIAFVAAFLFSTVAWHQVGLYELFFLANFAALIHPHGTASLTVLWSLAVEEQFYLFWPFAVRFLDRRQLIRLSVGVLIAEPILRAIASPFCETSWPIYYLTPFQLDGLAAGSLLALLVEDESTAEALRKWAGKMFGLIAATFVILSLLPGFHRDANTLIFNSLGYWLVYLGAAFLIAHVLLCPSSPISRILEWKPAVFLGSISYGFYLFHPVGITLLERLGVYLHFVHYRTLAPFGFVGIAFFSWLSFRYYEKPFIAWGKKVADRLQMSRTAELQKPSLTGPALPRMPTAE